MGNLTPATRITLASGLPAFAADCGDPVKVKCIYYGLADIRKKNGVNGNPIVEIQAAITENPVDADFCPVTECAEVELDADVVQVRLQLVDRLWYRFCVKDPNGTTQGNLDVEVLLKRLNG